MASFSFCCAIKAYTLVEALGHTSLLTTVYWQHLSVTVSLGPFFGSAGVLQNAFYKLARSYQ